MPGVGNGQFHQQSVRLGAMNSCSKHKPGWGLAARVFLGCAALAVVSANPTAALSAEGPAAKAERLGLEARAAYKAKNYDGAVALYLEAYDAAASPAILYNIAFIYDKKLNDREIALQYYNRVHSSSDAPDELKRKAQARITELSATPTGPTPPDPPPSDPATIDPPPRDPTPSDPNPPTDPPNVSGPDKPVWPWIVAGAGAAILGGGIALGVVAGGTADDFAAATEAADKRSLQSAARTEAAAADIMMVVGGAALATGVVLFFVVEPDSPDDGASVHIGGSVAPDGAAITLSGGF